MRISKKISRQTQFRIEQFIFKIIYYCCRVLPISTVLKFGPKLGNLAWRLQIQTSGSIRNVKLAFADRFSDEEVKKIAKESYQHFGTEIMRIFIMDRLAKLPIEDWIDTEGLDIVKNRGKAGGILVGGHFGCWEIACFLIPSLGEPATLFTGKHSNKVVGYWLDDIRRKVGMKTHSSADDRVELYNTVQNEIVAMLGDFRPAKAAIEVQFMGQKTETAQGPALLALLKDVDLIYFSCARVNDRIKVRFKKLEYEKTSSRKQNTILLTQAYYNELQADVEKYPGQYFWMHARWQGNPNVSYDDKQFLF
ncbi:lysophospholipid acyltransferase family protein [bacterium]|nr:lysophospholipid acyltransferase family protein [bacterium]